MAPIVEDLSQTEKNSEIKPPLASVINVIYAHFWRLKVYSVLLGQRIKKPKKHLKMNQIYFQIGLGVNLYASRWKCYWLESDSWRHYPWQFHFDNCQFWRRWHLWLCPWTNEGNVFFISFSFPNYFKSYCMNNNIISVVEFQRWWGPSKEDFGSNQHTQRK